MVLVLGEGPSSRDAGSFFCNDNVNVNVNNGG